MPNPEEPTREPSAPMTDAEREARENIEARMVMAHEFACAAIKQKRGRWVRDCLTECSCGADAKAPAMLDAYRDAILAPLVAQWKEEMQRERTAVRHAAFAEARKRVENLHVPLSETHGWCQVDCAACDHNRIARPFNSAIYAVLASLAALDPETP